MKLDPLQTFRSRKFCKAYWMLIYEYMPNKILDLFIFGLAL